jgi:hypothetical protein
VLVWSCDLLGVLIYGGYFVIFRAIWQFTFYARPCMLPPSADLSPSFRTSKIYQKPRSAVCAFFQDPPQSIVLNVAGNVTLFAYLSLTLSYFLFVTQIILSLYNDDTSNQMLSRVHYVSHSDALEAPGDLWSRIPVRYVQ